ncbi:MAG: 2-iminobutanoate/2-iminopropanoate deaminase [Desulfovibrio sp.]
MNSPRQIHTDTAPAAVGAYSQALASPNMVFTSGQLPINPVTGKMPEDVSEQARQSLINVKNILEAAGTGIGKVLKTTIYLADIKDFAAVNAVYETFFAAPFPARSCFAVKDLPLGAKVEIEAIAML